MGTVSRAGAMAALAFGLTLAGCGTEGGPPPPMVLNSDATYDTNYAGAYQHSAFDLGWDIGYGAYQQIPDPNASDEVVAKVAHNACVKAMAKYQPKSGSLADCEEAWRKAYRAAASASATTTHYGGGGGH